MNAGVLPVWPRAARSRSARTARYGIGVALGVVLLLSAGGVRGHEDRDLGIEIQDITPFAGGTLYCPVQLLVRNRGRERSAVFTVKVPRRGHEARKVLQLPPGETVVEIPVLNAGWRYMRVETFVDGRRSSDLSFGLGSRINSSTEAVLLQYGGGFRKAQDAIRTHRGGSGRGSSALEHIPVVPESAPRYWQCYVGLPGAVVIEEGTVLAPGAERALADWVRFGNGTLWIHGDHPERFARRLGFEAGEDLRFSSLPEEARVRACVTGALIFSQTESLEAMSEEVVKACAGLAGMGPELVEMARTAKDRRHLYGSVAGFLSGEGSGELRELFGGLHELPVFGYIALSLLFAVVVGPVNLVVLRQRNLAGLFYFTAPALALVGMVALGLYSAVREGFSIRSNEEVVLLHSPASDRGALYSARAMYAGMSPGEFDVSPRTCVVPVWRRPEDCPPGVMTDWSHGQRLIGWIPSRTEVGLLAITPKRVRLEVTMDNAADPPRLHNGLQYPVLEAWAEGAERRGQWWASGSVPAGSESPLRLAESIPGHEIRPELFAAVSRGARLLARTEGLPYEGDWSFQTRPERKTCYYLRVGAEVEGTNDGDGGGDEKEPLEGEPQW